MAIDDHSRVAFGSIEPNERGISLQGTAAGGSLLPGTECALRMRPDDNGACYKSRSFRRLARRLGMRHLRTRPYTLRTNGKAERPVQTSLRGWAYARSYASSEQRASAFKPWLHHYNWHRPHASLGYRPPISRILLSNALALHN